MNNWRYETNIRIYCTTELSVDKQRFIIEVYVFIFVKMTQIQEREGVKILNILKCSVKGSGSKLHLVLNHMIKLMKNVTHACYLATQYVI